MRTVKLARRLALQAKNWLNNTVRSQLSSRGSLFSSRLYCEAVPSSQRRRLIATRNSVSSMSNFLAVLETFWAISRTLRPRGEYCRNIFRGPGSGKILQHYSSGGKNIGQFFPHLYLVANGIMQNCIALK